MFTKDYIDELAYDVETKISECIAQILAKGIMDKEDVNYLYGLFSDYEGITYKIPFSIIRYMSALKYEVETHRLITRLAMIAMFQDEEADDE